MKAIKIFKNSHCKFIRDFTPPCGICRQVMEEFMADGTVVLSNGKEIKEYTVRDLLPAGFSAEDMKG